MSGKNVQIGIQGEPGATLALGPFTDVDKAIAAFEKKFTDKTRNDWNERDKFEAVAGKYTLIETAHDDDKEEEKTAASPAKSAGAARRIRPCTLDTDTQQLISMIFDTDMFKQAMVEMDIDVKKMPLGKLSKAQILKGFQILDELSQLIGPDARMKSANGKTTTLCTNEFYTVIPHDFGRQRPPVINTPASGAGFDDSLTVCCRKCYAPSWTCCSH